MSEELNEGLDDSRFWQEARDLIKRLEGTSVQRFAIQLGDYSLEVERAFAAPGEGGAMPTAAMSSAAAAAAEEDGGAGAIEGHAILAPLVGTFYRAGQPGAKPFVEEGDVVDAGQQVGIVEAMKLMNRVDADVAGRVVKILAGDGEWVEFEQVLMVIEPDGA